MQFLVYYFQTRMKKALPDYRIKSIDGRMWFTV